MEASSSLPEILAEIERQARDGNLAAVLVHMNDTYLIDDGPDRPGMARVAGLTRAIRETVQRLCGEDRTLVLHSGDYLSPSAMSQVFHGAQMVDLLELCGLDIATIGNHEFDFGGTVLLEHFAAPKRFRHVLANLEPPAGVALPKLLYWPPQHPFLAVTGLVGEQTIGKAEATGFRRRALDESVREMTRSLERHPSVGALIVLSHMDRGEDKDLQRLLSEQWDKYGYVYLLGGHDHDIYWREYDRQNCFLSKCRSNFKSITVVLVPADGVAAPSKAAIAGSRVFPSREEEIEIARHGRPEHRTPRASAEKMLDEVRIAYRTLRPDVRSDFRDAFERMITTAYHDRSEAMNAEARSLGQLAYEVLDEAAARTRSAFIEGARTISAHAHLEALPRDAAAVERVNGWRRRMPGRADDERVVADFGADLRLDARDEVLRRQSTDFGNFVADTIRAATRADIALINSGAFRLGSLVPGRITLGTLRDVFIYDGRHAIAAAMLDVSEVLSFYDHAAARGGLGAFLQVSESREAAGGRRGLVRTALVTHMVTDKEDGYQALLLASREVTPEALLRALGAELQEESMALLIERGAALGVSLDRGLRLTAATGPRTVLDELEAEFVALTRRFREVTSGARLSEQESLDLLEGAPSLPWDRTRRSAREHPEQVAAVVREMREFVRRAVARNDTGEALFRQFYDRLAHCRAGFEDRINYRAYFRAAYSFYGLL